MIDFSKMTKKMLVNVLTISLAQKTQPKRLSAKSVKQPLNTM